MRIPTLAPTPTAAPAATPTREPIPSIGPTALLTPRGTCREQQGQLSVAYLESATLARRVAYSLYLPPCYDADPARLHPALYLLHGANADHTQWPDLNVASNLDRLIAQQSVAPFVVVMPDGDYRAGEDYAAFVLRDLIPRVEQTVHVAPDRAHRAIGGLSQGGDWALTLAPAHPELFSAVGGHSPVANMALSVLPAPSALRIYLDVGRDDPLAAGVQAFAAALRARGFAPIVQVYAGGHNRPYWRAHTAEYLSFYAAGW